MACNGGSMSKVSQLRRAVPDPDDPARSYAEGAAPSPAIAVDPTPTVRIEPYRPDDAAATTTADAVLVDVVVLTADLDLFHAAREAVGERNPVWRARTADEAADLLITGRCGVLLLDLSSVSARGDTLVQQIVEQFPDVVVCVAGTQDDEPVLAPLISEGLIYRFMHKPCSPRRAGMFLQAAIRRHAEQRAGRGAGDPLLPLLRKLARPSTGLPRRYFIALGVIAVAAASALFVGGRPASLPAPVPTQGPAATSSASAVPSLAATTTDASRRADPVLARARAALQAGRLDSPEGRNALDLFQAVLLAEPTNIEAQQGLARTLDQLLVAAGKSASAGRKNEAERSIQRVLAASPNDPRALALMRQLNPPDTPSQQLEREQVAAVRAQADASAPGTMAPSPAAPVATGAPAKPMAITTTRATTAAASTSGPPILNPKPYPDPLTPRLVGGQAPSTPVTGRPRTRVFGAPISSGLPTAGYVNSPPVAATASSPTSAESRDTREPPSAATLSSRTDAAAASPLNASVVPADEFDRVYSREPVYPPQALRARTRGWVELEFTITPTGAVRDIDVVSAEPTGVFDRAASDALAAWRFRPRLVNGQPMAQRSTITMRFDVDN
jgi:TonB family protein